MNNSTITIPALRYFGGKWRLAPWIIQHFPLHECYVEPFCGAASVLLRKPLSPIEVINDLDSNVVTFFRVLRERTDELVRAIRLTPFSRQEYRLAWRPTEGLDPLEKARRYYVRSWQSWGGGRPSSPSGWRFQRDFSRGSSVADDWNRLDHLYLIAARLKRVFIECDEAFRTIERYDAPETLFYLDPPYLPELRGSGNGRSAYAYETDKTYHRRLLDAVRNLEAMVVISGYPSDLYGDLLSDWRCVKKDARTTNPEKQEYEALWLSPATIENQRQMRLF